MLSFSAIGEMRIGAVPAGGAAATSKWGDFCQTAACGVPRTPPPSAICLSGRSNELQSAGRFLLADFTLAVHLLMLTVFFRL